MRNVKNDVLFLVSTIFYVAALVLIVIMAVYLFQMEIDKMEPYLWAGISCAMVAYMLRGAIKLEKKQ